MDSELRDDVVHILVKDPAGVVREIVDESWPVYADMGWEQVDDSAQTISDAGA